MTDCNMLAVGQIIDGNWEFHIINSFIYAKFLTINIFINVKLLAINSFIYAKFVVDRVSALHISDQKGVYKIEILYHVLANCGT